MVYTKRILVRAFGGEETPRTPCIDTTDGLVMRFGAVGHIYGAAAEGFVGVEVGSITGASRRSISRVVGMGFSDRV